MFLSCFSCSEFQSQWSLGDLGGLDGDNQPGSCQGAFNHWQTFGGALMSQGEAILCSAFVLDFMFELFGCLKMSCVGYAASQWVRNAKIKHFEIHFGQERTLSNFENILTLSLFSLAFSLIL